MINLAGVRSHAYFFCNKAMSAEAVRATIKCNSLEN
ncbi:hypothetical protein NEOC95_001643 [Neochlamydia sp. AcF95]|nr:hypothetical protein [Neochlamydia sp. AcF95]